VERNRSSSPASLIFAAIVIFGMAASLGPDLLGPLLGVSVFILLAFGWWAMRAGAVLGEDDGAPVVDDPARDIEEMRQARSTLQAHELPEWITDGRTSELWQAPPAGLQPLSGAQATAVPSARLTAQERAEIARYARSREPSRDALPAWRSEPPDFPLDVLNRLGTAPRPPLPSHAVLAAESANVAVHESVVLAVDLGVLVYRPGDEKPALHRDAPIPDTADYVQPFVDLWFEQPTGGTVRLRLLDAGGIARFVSELPLDAGSSSVRRLMLSRTRLPIGDHLPIGDGWTLDIAVDGQSVALHHFDWYDPDGDDALIDHLAADGELTVDLAALVEQVTLVPMSLDDLLDGDDAADNVR
jgi:hypothetical protein